MTFTNEVIQQITTFSNFSKVVKTDNRIWLTDYKMDSRISLPSDLEFDFDHRERFIDIEADNFIITIYKKHFSIHINK